MFHPSVFPSNDRLSSGLPSRFCPSSSTEESPTHNGIDNVITLEPSSLNQEQEIMK